MPRLFGQIAKNAQRGISHCEGCPAHETCSGKFVNPGLLNPDGDLMFVTEEPSHLTDWEQYDSWNEYNAEWGEKFKSFDGGEFISRLLEPTDLAIEDIWVADSIKCPTQGTPEKGIPDANTTDSARHCRGYLRSEIEEVDPEAIVTLGRRAMIQTLLALDVPWDDVRHVRVTKDYGKSEFDTAPPVVVCLHWAQRSVRHDEFIPVVKESIVDVLQD